MTSIKFLLSQPITSLDLNGVLPTSSPDILFPALVHTDVLHLNQEETTIITGITIPTPPTLSSLQQAASVLFSHGVAIVAITLGEEGAYVGVTSSEGRILPESALSWQARKWKPGTDVLLPAYPLTPGAQANTNGAGDAFVAGLLLALLTTAPLTLEEATKVALLTALQRVDSSKREKEDKMSFEEVVALARRKE